ncbi:MAG: alpha-2-macroglobulin family protein [Flavobacteriales bacterium]
MKHFFKKYSLFAIILFSLFSCNEKKTTSDVTQFKNTIDWFTDKDISIKSDIEVRVKNKIPLKDLNQEQMNALFTISPKIEGKVEQIAGTTFRFIPKERLKFNTEYHVQFDLKGVSVGAPDQDVFKFVVKTKPLQMSVSKYPLESISKDYQRAKFTVYLNDVFKSEQLNSIIKLNSESGKLKCLQKEGLEFESFTFIIDSLERQENNHLISLEWKETEFGSKAEGKLEWVISGKNTFQILDVKIIQEPSQIVKVHFSDPVLKNQNLEGLVQLGDLNNLQYKIDQNVLNIYPKNRIETALVLKIDSKLKNADRYQLKNSYINELMFKPLMPNIELLSNGTILPNSDGLFLNIETTSLYAVNVEVTKIFEDNILQFLQYNSISGNSGLNYVGKSVVRKSVKLFDKSSNSAKGKSIHAIDLANIIRVDPNTIYRVQFSFNPNHVVTSCKKENNEENTPIKPVEIEFNEKGLGEFSEYPISYRNQRHNNRNNACSEAFYYYNSSKRRKYTNVLASNIGLTVKKDDDGTLHFIAVNMITNNVLPSTNIKVYSFQQQELGQTQTNSKGFAKLKLKNNDGYFAIASHGKDKVYLRIPDGSALSMSKFDVSGMRLKNGLKGFVYLERGVRRPGDDIPVTMVLEDNNDHKKMGDHPVTFELYNPEQKLVYKNKEGDHLNGVYSTVFHTSSEAKTGNWQVKVKVGGAVFSKTVKIETVKPNRLKINTDLGDQKIILKKDDVNGSLKVNWLHGAVASNLKADVRMKLKPAKTEFKNYKSYDFGNVARNFVENEQTIFEGELDEDGLADFSINPSFNNAVSGFVRGQFLTKVYEKGGDFSTNVESKLLSPYEAYVGIKFPKAENRYDIYYTDKSNLVKFISLNENGKPIKNKKLHLRVYKVSWRWWWHSGRDDLSNYINSSYYEPIVSTSVKTNAKGEASYDISLPRNSWGRYLVYIEDEETGHAAGKTMHIDWPDWQGRSSSGNASEATMLAFSTDKMSYEVGETAVVTIPSSEEGRALISIENGHKVLEKIWVETQKGETVYRLPISKEMTPNVYLNIMHLQSHAQTKNDIPIRTYGVRSIEVVDPNTQLHPEISMPEKLRPETEFEIKISEKNGAPMTYTIQIVDEGLLDLTKYKTPNPWYSFYSKEALGVKTWDVYNSVIGAYGGTVDQILAIGGDQSVEGTGGKKANRFKPVALHLGPFELKSGTNKVHKVKLPSYFGSVKTMVVASNTATKAYGSAFKQTPVKKPVMLLASAPRSLVVSETFKVPVTVFAMEDHIKSVQVSISGNEFLSIVGDKTKTIKFSKPGEQIVMFDVNVLDKEGIGTLDIKAKSGSEMAKTNIEFNVLNPNPYSTKVERFVLDKNTKQKNIKFESFGVENSRSVKVEFSNFQPFDYSKRLENLIGFPYGCLEQTTSKAFPQLYIGEIVDLNKDDKKRVEYFVNSAINKLSGFQRYNGGLSYWPYSSYYESWAEVYAAHFLIEAESYGYSLPGTLKTNLLNHFKQKSNVWSESNSYSALTQAYRLYVLAKANEPELSAMNRLREQKNISNQAKYRLAHAYILVGQKQIAEEILKTIHSTENKRRYYDSFSSDIRDAAMEMETELALGHNTKVKTLSNEIRDGLNNTNYWMSTQTIGFGLRVMCIYAKSMRADKLTFDYELNQNGKKDVSTGKSMYSFGSALAKGKQKLNINNHSGKPLYVNLITKGKYPIGQDEEIVRGLTVSVTYKDLDGNWMKIDSLKQGTNFIAEVSVRNGGNDRVKNVALSHFLPSGWEIINTRFTGYGMPENSKNDFTDIRDTRVDYFFSMNEGEVKTFKVVLNASYLGRFYIPGIQSEAMYDNDYFVRKTGSWVNVLP